MNIIDQVEQEQIAKLTEGKTIPEFRAGDTLRVGLKIRERSGKKVVERVQYFEGVCIARSGGGINASFTVRKISFNESVERVLPLYAPVIDSIQVVRRGKVRRAKLYYLRELRGRKARIAEKRDHKAKSKKDDNKTAKKTAS